MSGTFWDERDGCRKEADKRKREKGRKREGEIESERGGDGDEREGWKEMGEGEVEEREKWREIEGKERGSG